MSSVHPRPMRLRECKKTAALEDPWQKVLDYVGSPGNGLGVT